MIGYLPFNTFIFRTHYFPISALSDFGRFSCESTFKEMLQIATPDLSENIDKNTDRVLFAVYRYYQRACTRSTPFGLFAGCSVGKIGDRTNIQLSEQKKYKRSTRLDMNYICALTQQIEKNKNIREQLLYYPNSSIYPIGNYLRYVEYHYRKTRRIHRICQVENSEFLQRVLILAQKGALFRELAELLTDDEITKSEANQFIHELIDIQLLVSELEPSVTNVQPFKTLILKLNGLQNVDKNFIGILSDIDKQLTLIAQQPIGKTVNIYQEIVHNIEKTKIDSETKYLFQTDLFKPVEQATVSWHFIRDIQQALQFLNKITPISTVNNNLLRFKENFIKRYESKEMPLLFVLDNELGLGYAKNTSGDICPLIDDLIIPQENSKLDTSGMPTIQSILMQKYHQSFQKIIELTDADINGFRTTWNDLPPTFSVICQLLHEDDNGRTVYIKSVHGMSATAWLGRFCHLDEQILNHTRAIAEKEAQNLDVIFAEIVHLPESRTGNILLRPVLRPYEISYLAKAGISKEFELRLDDLFVSIKNNRIVLRSKRLNKEIIPRMSSAHNYSGQSSMPVYHFLCDMQHQGGRSGLGFHWNEAAQQMDYLPRIIYKNCILSRARWNVYNNEVKVFAELKDATQLLVKIKEWRNSRDIPNKVILADGDNELYVDMDNQLSVRAWLSIVTNRQSFCLEEFLFDSEKAVVRGPEGVFSNEFIFAFYKES